MYIYTMNTTWPLKKKNEILPFAATWMALEGIRLSEISQMEKDCHHTLSLICGTKKKKTKNQPSEHNKKRDIDNKLVVIAGKVGSGNMRVIE